MAPFLRIAFNSYELGSLQAADEASQPFCAVKMKEALSTGRAGGWTLRGSSQWSWESGPGGRQRRGPALCPRTSEGPFLPHPCLPAQPSYGGRTAEATQCLWGLQHWLHGALTGARGSGSSSPNSFHLSVCQAPCWAPRTSQCSRDGLALPSGGFPSGGGARR